MIVSFGADGPTVFTSTDDADLEVRNSVFGALQDKSDGVIDASSMASTTVENEHPFELFMIEGRHRSAASVDRHGRRQPHHRGPADQRDRHLGRHRAADVLDVYIQQIDAQTIVGYVIRRKAGRERAIKVAREGSGVRPDHRRQRRAQLRPDHQLNHDQDGHGLRRSR